jgi:hypothetical protein
MLHLAALRVRVSAFVRTASARSRVSLALPVILLALLGFSAPGFSQSCTGLCLKQVSCPNGGTTSLTGRVFAPNGVDPLPNVLVYIPNAAVAPFTPGVACEQAGEPASGSPLVSTTSAVDGSFTLTNVPVGTNIPLVIQTGRWRRQVVILSVSACVNRAVTANLTRLPRTQAEGDIPKIAITTGVDDAVECVLRKIGVADSEFTDPSGNGRINLFAGDGAPGSSGAIIDANTPLETKLVQSQAVLNRYDLVMFGCQGDQFNPQPAFQQNLINYANAGGRVFANHFEYVWLYNDAPFAQTANWNVEQHPSPANQTGFINMSFPRGQQLAQWLQEVNASPTFGQIPLQVIRKDQSGVVAPTQSWMTINDSVFPGSVVQFTFNTPVGAPTAQQCGRVLFNEYHVENTSNSSGATFPSECAAGVATAQEKLLEFELFDLSTAVSPDIPPTASVAVTSTPTTFSQGDTNDTVTVNVTNTSTSTPTNPSLALSVFMPVGLSANSIAGTNAGTGWTCALNTLTCTRTSGLTAGANDPVVLGVSVTAAPSATPTSVTVSASVAGGGLAIPVTASDDIIIKGVPTITWATPAAITYPTALSGTQQDATASTAGTFVYSPVSGTVLDAGPQTLGVTFTPADPGNFSVATSSAVLTVNQATQTISFVAPSPVTFGVAPIVLSASGGASGNPVTFSYISGPATLSGNILTVTGAGAIVVAADQAGNTDYSAATPVQQNIVVNAASQTISFTGLPANATFGAAGPYTLNGTASSSLPVSYSVSGPASLSGTTLTITGVGTVAVTASQAGNTNFSAATPVTQTIIVGAASQTVTFTGLPANATFGSAGPYTLNGTASSGLPVSYSVSGPASLSDNTLTITGPGTVAVTASQAGNSNFSAATPVTQTVIVSAANQTITFNGLPSAATFGTAGPYTLNGTASSGLPVSYSLSGPGSLSGNTLTITGPGTVAVTASQAGNSNFNPAPPVTQTIVVSATTGTVLLTTTTVLSKVGSSYQAVITFTNSGTGTALNVQLTSAILGAATGTPLPAALGAIASGGGKQTVTLTFPSTAGASGAAVVEKLVGSYTGGSFSIAARATLP